MIPKVLHYCWFGSDSKPDYFFKCKKSWVRSFPDFKIIEWNESNSDLSHPILQDAIRKEKWAFVSDFVRLQVLVKYGGIYLDTDMLFIRPFDPQFLNYSFFLGMENANSLSAGILGGEPENEFLRNSLNFYLNLDSTQFGNLLIPEALTRVFLNTMYHEIIPMEVKQGRIFPCHVFYPLPFKLKRYHWNLFLKPDSLAIHLWAGSWMENEKSSLFKRLFRQLKYQFSKFYVPKSFLKYRDKHFRGD